MSKNYRNKEACLEEARRLGIEGAEDMTWPQLQKAVSDGLKREELGVETISAKDEAPVDMNDNVPVDIREKVNSEVEKLRPYIDKTVVISPELNPERYRLLKYDEDLGQDIEVEERRFDMNRETDEVFDISGDLGDRHTIDQYHDYLTGTYRLKRRGDRRVTAMASVPKENSGMLFRVKSDLVPVVTWKGRSGYLWQHMFLPNVKQLLMESGHYAEYRDKFVGEPNVWYAAGKQLVCDPHLVHQVFQEIEEKEQRKMENSRVNGWRE